MSYKMDMSKFKKVSSDKTHTVMRSEDGHEMKIAHKPLSSKMRSQLDKLPLAMAEGGEVADKEQEDKKKKEESPVVINVGGLQHPQLPEQLAAQKNPNEIPPMPAESSQAVNFPSNPQSPQQPPQDQQLMPPVEPSNPKPQQESHQGAAPDLMHGYEKQASGMSNEAKAIGQKAESDKIALAGQIKAVTDMSSNYQTHYNELDNERKAFQQDLVDKHIDPNHYMGNMDTSRKFDTAVGLILGGLGGGGNSNQALDFLNKQIDRDIASQEKELGKRETLLSANLKQFGNLKDATDMTRVMQSDMLIAKLKQAEARAATPMAKAHAQQEIGKLEMQVAPIVQKIATNKLVAQLEAEAQSDPSKYPQLLRTLEQVDPEKAKELRGRLVPGVGLTETSKDAADIKELRGMTKSAKAGINDLLKIADQPGKSMSLETKAKAGAIRQSLIGMLRVPITGPGAMSEGERKMLENLVADPTALFSLDSSNKIKLKTLASRLDQSVNEMEKARGLNPLSKEKELDPQQQSFAAWANKNKNSDDPAMAQKAMAVLKKLGLE